MAAPIVFVVAALLVGGGSLGGVAYYDGVFTAIPLSQIDGTMINETITVKGIIEKAVYFGPWSFSYSFSTWGGSNSVSGSGGDNSWFLLRDRDNRTHAFALVSQGGTAPEEGKSYVVTGKLVYFESESDDGLTWKIAYIVSESYHKPILFG